MLSDFNPASHVRRAVKRTARPASTVTQPAAVCTPQLVVLDYHSLQAGEDLTPQVLQAFGKGGLGLCAVRGIPELQKVRRQLLPLALKLGSFPAKVLNKYELPETSYCFGWSRGREKFKGVPDTAKGSFYANPIYDDPADGDEAVRAKYPYAASRNVWPSELPELEHAFKEAGRLMYEAAQPLVKQCDALVAAAYPEHTTALHSKTFTNSRLALGRLLHYYPGKEDSWCGWHNDNSVITGLLPAMWFDSETQEEVTDMDTEAGLHVQGRDGAIQRVAVPKDCMIFQVGEAAQIISGGVLRATPHFVRGHTSRPGEPQVSRETFALFMEPHWDAMIGPPRGSSYEDIIHEEETELLPPLSKRLKPNPDTGLVEFGKFLGDSFQEYYKHNNPPIEASL